MERNTYETDVVVIGGGMAGLAAATYLARAGKEVVLFEKSAGLGGRAASQERNGSIFNLGAHAIYSKSAAAEVLRELGVTYTGGTPTGVRCLSEGKFHLAPADVPSLFRTDLLDRAAKLEVTRVLVKLQLASPESLARMTLAEWLDREVHRPDVRRFLEASARVATYTNAPDQISMGMFVDQFQQVSKGKVVYVDGGWQTLVNGLEEAARAAGVRIITGARVATVEHSSGVVSGVRLSDGTTHHARAVLVAGSPRDALELVEGGEHLPLGRWAKAAVPVKAACLDVALRRLPVPQNRVVIGMDGPLFLTTQSEFSRVAPTGGALIYTLKYLDPFAPPDAEADRRELEAWLDQAQPGWRDEVVECRFLPHLTVSNALVKASEGGLGGRPGPDVPGVRNLYVAGDWVGPRGLLASASLWSARLAAYSIMAGSAEGKLSRAA